MMMPRTLSRRKTGHSNSSILLCAFLVFVTPLSPASADGSRQCWLSPSEELSEFTRANGLKHSYSALNKFLFQIEKISDPRGLQQIRKRIKIVSTGSVVSLFLSRSGKKITAISSDVGEGTSGNDGHFYGFTNFLFETQEGSEEVTILFDLGAPGRQIISAKWTGVLVPNRCEQ
jgi:hypothetical protein